MVFDDILAALSLFSVTPMPFGLFFWPPLLALSLALCQGLTAAAAIAMMLPILIAYNDEIGGLAGLAFLYVIGKSGRYGGSIAAIYSTRPEPRHRRPQCKMAIR